MNNTYRIVWGTSRGMDTYGYTTCSCIPNNGKRASCNGGGYDMEGTVLADVFAREFSDEIKEYLKKGEEETGSFVRLTDKGEVLMDGAVGTDTVIRFMERCGIRITRICNKPTIYQSEKI